jgi:hypothetical protein
MAALHIQTQDYAIAEREIIRATEIFERRREHPRMDAEYKYSGKYSREKAEEKVENRKSEPRSRE